MVQREWMLQRHLAPAPAAAAAATASTATAVVARPTQSSRKRAATPSAPSNAAKKWKQIDLPERAEFAQLQTIEESRSYRKRVKDSKALAIWFRQQRRGRRAR
jgi:hypothetical protein